MIEYSFIHVNQVFRWAKDYPAIYTPNIMTPSDSADEENRTNIAHKYGAFFRAALHFSANQGLLRVDLADASAIDDVVHHFVSGLRSFSIELGYVRTGDRKINLGVMRNFEKNRRPDLNEN